MSPKAVQCEHKKSPRFLASALASLSPQALALLQNTSEQAQEHPHQTCRSALQPESTRRLLAPTPPPPQEGIELCGELQCRFYLDVARGWLAVLPGGGNNGAAQVRAEK